MQAEQTTGFKRIAALRIDQPSIFSINHAGGDFQVIVDDLDGVPDGIQVDKRSNVVYWTNMGRDFNADDGSVEAMVLDGTKRTLLAGRGALTTPKQIVLDDERNLLYWCDREGSAVFRSKTDGSELTRLVDRSSAVGGKGAMLNQCVGIALDKSNDRLLWTQKGPPKGGQGRIFCAGLEVPAGETASNRSDIKVLLEHLPEPIDLEIDAENSLLYWTDRGAPPYGNSLNRATLSPHGLIEPQVICTGFAEAIGLAVDATAHVAYVADLAGQIWCVDLGTGRSEVMFKRGRITGIALY
ncbi:hypothetical protein [Dyella humicola]|uniref:hypothetical protein n=1 Tax=Dyella humicola TaxID=2992126 RepID=UPI0022508EFC|nr:hypothetical protein [Dyella humicola]